MSTSFSEKHLIILIGLLFVVSSTFLFWQNNRELDPDRDKNWWTLSFVNPADGTSLAFTIENHSAAQDFTYEVSSAFPEDQMSEKHPVTLLPGKSLTVTPESRVNGESRTKIIVTTGTETKSIYR